jgi:hypothetical protein
VLQEWQHSCSDLAYSSNLGKCPFIGNVNNKSDVTHPIYAKISTLSYKKQMKMDLSKNKSHQNEN